MSALDYSKWDNIDTDSDEEPLSTGSSGGGGGGGGSSGPAASEAPAGEVDNAPADVDVDTNDVDGRTPVTVLTGFLGSGKTTLLNVRVEYPAQRRTPGPHGTKPNTLPNQTTPPRSTFSHRASTRRKLR